MTALYDRVITITSKPPNRREEAEVVELLPWFQKKSEIFRSLAKDVILDLIRNCQFSAVERDTVVIRQGDKGDSFFIILRGVVSVYVNTDIADKDEEMTKEQLPLKYNESKILDRRQFGQEISTLESGKAFGELALINDNCIRNASIVANERTDLLVVNRELFNRSLCSVQAADFAARTRFAQEHPLFRDWAAKHRRQLAMSIRREKRNFDQSIVKQGDGTSAMYFIIRGQGKVTVDPHLHRLQFPQLMLSEIQDQKSSNQNPTYDDQGYKRLRSKAEASDWSSSDFDQKRRKNQRKRLEISVVAVNEILGDIEFVLDLKSYVYSVTCIQDCEVFSLNAQNYDRLVSRRNPKTSELLRDSAHLKLFARLSRFQPDELPLLRTLLEKLEVKQQPKNGRKVEVPSHSRYEVRMRNSARQFSFKSGTSDPGNVLDRNGIRQEPKWKKKKEEEVPTARTTFTKNAVGKVVACTTKDAPALNDKSRLGAADVDRIGDPSYPELPGVQGRDFEDVETSDETLAALESRIRTWHSAVATGANGGCTKLHRCYIDRSTCPVRGSKVIVRKRPAFGVQIPELLGTLAFPVLQSHGIDDFRILVSVQRLTGGSTSTETMERDSATLISNSDNSSSEIPVGNKQGKERNYTSEEYSILKKQLLKCQRKTVKFGKLF